MEQSSSKIPGPTLVRLTVISGPDAGKTHVYNKGRVTLGRDAGNDFVITDGFVSSRHGELIVKGNEIVYRDLKSRHGSFIRLENHSLHLHNKQVESHTQLIDGAEVQVGATLIKLLLSSIEDSPDQLAMAASQNLSGRSDTERLTVEVSTSESFPAPRYVEDSLQSPDEHASLTPAIGAPARERLITAAHKPVHTLTQTFSGDDKRLAILFRLAGQLNGLTVLNEIIDLIVEATFEAFPAANFFAVTLLSSQEQVEGAKPFISRMRGTLLGGEDDDDPLISTSILKRVVDSRESVLFVKDSLGTDVTQSILDAKITACMCAPLVGQRSLLGVMQVDTRGRGSLFSRQDLDLFNILASNVAFAIERAKLSESIMEMFEGFVAASVNAIEARDPVTAGHSERVAHYTLELANAVNGIQVGKFKDIYLDSSQLTELRYAALLHDFGKIAVPEHVLSKDARLPGLHMNIVAQRFETIKALEHMRMLRRFYTRLQEDCLPNGKLPSLDEVEEAYFRFSKELDEILLWLGFVSEASMLNDEQIERVKELAQRYYYDAHGNRCPYLSDEEVDNLCIRRGTLNEDEWVHMRNHAAFSEQYLKRIPWSDELCHIPCIAGAHHEKLDGTGYPNGLQGEQIIPQVRMLTISDIFDALTASDRPYRKAATIDSAVNILELEARQNKLDMEFVDVFARLVVPNIHSVIPKRQA